MKINGDPVTVIDGLDWHADFLLKSKNANIWKNSLEKISKKSLVVPMNLEAKEFGLCLGRILGLNLNAGFMQYSNKCYSIKKHNHETDLKAIYAIFYLWNKGDPGYINLYDKDVILKRETGKILIIPENRYHSVDDIKGESQFLRYVFTKEPIKNRILNKSLLMKMKKNINFTQV